MAAELLRAVDVWVDDAKQLNAAQRLDPRPPKSTGEHGGGG